ncbi:MAG: hypothetical protein EOO85_29545, partial [Pedobacter sp.]
MNLKYYLLPAAVFSLTSFSNAYAVDMQDVNPFGNIAPSPSTQLDEVKTNPQLNPVDDSASEKIKITEIVVSGTDKKESVLISMFLKPGETATPSQIREDLQRIYGLGYFLDVQAAKEQDKDGFKLIINVVENPVLRDVQVFGNN